MQTNGITLLLILLSSISFAQDLHQPTITSTGEASGKFTPTHVEFTVSAAFSEKTFGASSKKAVAFEALLAKALESSEFDPESLTFRAPQINAINTTSIRVSGILRFALPDEKNQSERLIHLANLCDAIVSIGRTLNTEFTGPSLVVDGSEVLEQEVLKRATENALYKASAITQIMNTRIYDVLSVEIQKIIWHTDEGQLKTAPGLDAVTCTAKVVLTYLHAP